MIECELSTHHTTKQDRPSYAALSYTWGEIEGGQNITIDGKTMYARANLHACLKLLQRHRLSDDFWIDAICINQGDLEEKGIQVQKMSEIYSQAQVVAICLPASDEEAAVFNEALQIFRDAYRPEIGGPDWHDPRKTYNAVQWLATNPYFRRMWIVQENALASERVLLCGSQQTPFFYVERMVGESEMFVPAGRDQCEHGE